MQTTDSLGLIGGTTGVSRSDDNSGIGVEVFDSGIVLGSGFAFVVMVSLAAGGSYTKLEDWPTGRDSI